MEAARAVLSQKGVRNFLSLMLSQFLAAVVGLLSTRFLSPADKGLFTGAYLWSVVGQALAGLSVPNAILFFGARESRSRLTVRLVGMLALLAAVTGAVIAYAMGVRKGAPVAFCLVLAALPAVELAFEVTSYTLLVETGSFNVYRLVQVGSFAAAGAAAVIVTHSPTVLLTCLGASCIVYTGLQMKSAGRGAGRPRLGARRLLRWSFRYHPGLAFSLLAGRADILLVTLLLTPYQAGQYAAASALPGLLSYAGTALGLSMAAKVSDATRTGPLPSSVLVSAWWLATCTAVVATALIVAGPAILVLLFGVPYQPARGLLLPLSVALPLWNLAAFQTQMLSASGRSLDQVIGTGVAAAVLIVGTAYGVWHSNLLTVAWSNVAAYGCSVVWQGACLVRARGERSRRD